MDADIFQYWTGAQAVKKGKRVLFVGIVKKSF